MFHDIYFTNETGMDLHEVNVAVNLVGEDGVEKSEKKYFGVWLDGNRQKVSISIANSPSNVQKFTLRGRCTEGNIDQSWAP